VLCFEGRRLTKRRLYIDGEAHPISIYMTHVKRGARQRTYNVVLRAWREFSATRQALLPRLRLAHMLGFLLPTFTLSTIRAALYRRVFPGIGRRVSILSNMQIVGDGPGLYKRLLIGEGSLIGAHSILNLDGPITIGRNVSLGPHVAIYTSTHLLGPGSRRMSLEVIARPVVIEDGVWIGVRSTILPGVVVGRGSVVGAGSVVAKNVPPDTMVVGNPAAPVQQLPWGDR